MFFYILLFLIIFISIFFVCLFCLVKKDLVIENLYLIIPAICIGFWALYSYFDQDPWGNYTWDLLIVYLVGRQVITNPGHLYDIPTFLYMPNFAIFLALIISLFPYSIAYPILFTYNFIWGILANREYNKILILMDVKEKIHRFIFLMIISNGFFIYTQFYMTQTKYLLFLVLLFIIRREFQFKNVQKDKDLKYYLINYNLFILAIGMAPHFIFYFIIYLFQDIPRKEILKKENIRKFSLAVIFFIIQNFFFIIYPYQIFEFLDGFNVVPRLDKKMKLLYLRDWVNISSELARILSVLSLITLSIFTLILLLKNGLPIYKKFGYFSIAYILIGVQFYHTAVSLIFFSFVLLLFVPYLDQEKRGFEFIKSNKILLIGVFSILIIFFLDHGFIIYEFIHEPTVQPFVFIDNIRWIVFISTMLISLIFLELETKRNIKEVF